MAGFNLTEADKVMKVFYLPIMRSALNKSTVLLSRIAKDSSTQNVDGKSFTTAIHYGRNAQAGSGRAENGTLPAKGNQAYNQAVVPNKYIYTTGQISGPVMSATKTNAGSYIRALERELKGAMEDTKRSVNRQLHGDGKDALAFCTATDTTTPVVVDDGYGNVFSHLPSGVPIICDIIATADNSTKRADSVTFTQGAETSTGFNVAWSSGSLSGAVDGDYFVLEDTLGYQMMGIGGIISDDDCVVPAGGGTLTSLHGLAVASNPWWAAQLVGPGFSAPEDLNIANLQKLLSKIGQNSAYSEADVAFLLCSYGVRDKYVQLCLDERRHFNTMTFDNGFEAVTFNNKAIVPDPQCKRGVIYAIVPESLTIMRSEDFGFMDKDGSTLSRVSGVDAYEFTILHYGDLSCNIRNANGAYEGISEA